MELNEAARRIVGQHWLLILILVVLGAGGALLLHLGDEKTYTASTRLVLDTNDPESSAESAAIRDAARGIATSPAQVNAALGKAGIADRDASDIAQNDVSVSSLGTSAVLRLSVSDRDRQAAAAISNALAAQVISTRLGRTKGETAAVRPRPLIISAATPPGEADSSRTVPDMILGALLGLILGLGLAALVETMRPTVVGGDALARELDAPLLGRLPGPPDDERSLAKTGLIGERLSLAAEAGDVHDIGLVYAGPEVNLGPLSKRLETISSQTQPELVEVGTGSESAWGNMGAVGGGDSGFHARPLRPHQPSYNERRALVVVSPEVLKKSELGSTHHLLRITGFPVLGVVTYPPSRRRLPSRTTGRAPGGSKR